MSEGAITQLIAGVPITESNPERAGTGRITFPVTGLNALLERLVAAGIEHEQIETYSNGVRHARVPDPDGNAIAFAEPPEQLGGG